MYSKELLKGTLSAIILNLLAENGKMYGYQITQKVKELSEGKILIKEGSLYPALFKLKDEGLVKTETVNIGKRVRRYYYLTEQGNNAVVQKIKEIYDFINTLKKLFFFELNYQTL
jgi:DNA-binding PadR family transcriptional regulator